MSSSDDISWGHSTVETACPLDCPDCCKLAVSVENGRIVAIDAAPHEGTGTTGGFICAKVRNFADRVYGQFRLAYPMIRKGRKGSGEFSRVTWEDAMARIADRMR